MLRKLDRIWFRLLDRLNLWTLNQLAAHCRRERERRFRRLFSCHNHHLN